MSKSPYTILHYNTTSLFVCKSVVQRTVPIVMTMFPRKTTTFPEISWVVDINHSVPLWPLLCAHLKTPENAMVERVVAVENLLFPETSDNSVTNKMESYFVEILCNLVSLRIRRIVYPIFCWLLEG